MKSARIKAILLHTWYHFSHSMETWVDLLWNSAIQMIIFSLLAVAYSTEGIHVQSRYMLIGMVLWNIIWVGQYAVTVGALWEIWSRSWSTMFITPLSLSEFIMAQILASIPKSLIAVVVADLIAYLIFGFSVSSLGWLLLVVFIILIIYSWGLGMGILSIIIRYGTDVQSLSWALVNVVGPLGAVYFPLAILPPVVRKIAYFFPTTYLFEEVRKVMIGGTISWINMGIALITSLMTLVGGAFLLNQAFKQAKVTGGLARMLS